MQNTETGTREGKRDGGNTALPDYLRNDKLARDADYVLQPRDNACPRCGEPLREAGIDGRPTCVQCGYENLAVDVPRDGLMRYDGTRRERRTGRNRVRGVFAPGDVWRLRNVDEEAADSVRALVVEVSVRSAKGDANATNRISLAAKCPFCGEEMRDLYSTGEQNTGVYSLRSRSGEARSGERHLKCDEGHIVHVIADRYEGFVGWR